MGFKRCKGNRDCASTNYIFMYECSSEKHCCKYDSQAIIKKGKKMITGLLVMVAGNSPEKHLIHIVQRSWLVASIAHLEGLPTLRQCLANLF
ncbi:hypothetical protein NC651_026709 [Populus alba x Populus x berolinensis]|nr:hypothetical protein NC651_026709 [Populus alba x Populus x berolinensis]